MTTMCKHGETGECALCAHEDQEHDAYMSRADYPAFPLLLDGATRTDASGLTRRDYFAAAALTGLLAMDAKYGGRSDRAKLTRDAVLHADALIWAMGTSS